MLRFGKATYLSLPFKFNLSESQSIILCGSGVCLFFESINIVSIMCYICIVFIFSNFFCSIHRIYNMMALI